VRDKCRDLGIAFRPWQYGAGRLILAKRADGKYAATIGGTGMSIPRQVGKTFLVGAIIFALCILRPNLTVLWTAHRLRTAEETFGKMQAFAKRKKIKPFILKIVLGSGEEAVLFRNGSRILFGARERGFGLGFDEVDIEVFDEAQRLTEGALDDMIPATNQSRESTGALVLFMGTPPRPTDPGEVFTRMRTEALSGEDDDTAWIEFGADPGFVPTPSPAPLGKADWEQVAKANPSFPDDTPREAILRMRKKLGPDSFLREGLGIWDEEAELVNLPNWLNLRDVASQALDPVAFAVDMAADRSWTAISASGRREDGRMHGVVIDYRPGTYWTVDRIFELVEKWRPCAFALDPDSPAGSLIKPLEERGLITKCGCHGEQGLMLIGGRERAQACGGLYDDCDNDRFRHLDQRHLNLAVERAVTKPAGDAWVWSLKLSPVDIAPLRSLAWARHAFLAHAQPEIDLAGMVAWG
jgi:hypothetical protein